MFIHGCNYPWSTDGTTAFYGLDFGANVWGSHLGVSTRRTAVERDFQEMASLGFTVSRWFVFADGRAGIVFDEGGTPAGLDPHFFTDLDAGLEVAAAAGVQVHLVLLDHRWVFEGVRDSVADPATGMVLELRLRHGRAHVLQTAPGRRALFDRVFVPIVQRYARGGRRADLGPRIFGLELMNEPDFVVEEWERDLSSRVGRPVKFDALASMVADLSDLVHASLPAIATIGCARPHNLWAWDDQGLGLDLLQIHSYPDARRPGRDLDAIVTPTASLGLTKPVLLGEFPGNPAEQHPAGASPVVQPVDEVMESALRGGYAGAWPWSFSGTDAYGRLPAAPLRAFAARHPEVSNPRATLPNE